MAFPLLPSFPQISKMTTPAIERKLVTAINGLAFRVCSQLSEHGKNRNLSISPLSLSIAIALLNNGADGSTAQELAEFLGIQDIEPERVNTAYADILGRLGQHHGNANRLSIANSLWVRPGLTLKPEFVHSSQNFYSTEVFNLDFANSDNLSVINEWIDRQTNGNIKKIVSSADLHANTILILLNAIYFKGVWQQQFDRALTQEALFILSDRQSKLYPMMSQSGSYEYCNEPEFQAIVLPYSDSNITMTVFLPHDRISLTDFLQPLNVDKFRQWKSQFSMMQGDLTLPRFTIDYEESLIDIFKILGLEIALSARANYQKIADRAIAVSDIKHKALIEVNEEGTAASAATGVMMQRSLRQKFRMVVNRPFFFVIQDEQTGIILFMGAVWEPS
jgi:serine protease inhibitor